MQVTAVQGRQTETGHARCCKHGSNRFYCIPWSRAENEGPAGAQWKRSTPVVVINHRISRSTTFESVHAVHERTVTERRTSRTDSGHGRFTRAAIVSTKAEETKRLRRNRVSRTDPRNLVHYFRARIHTRARSLSIYLRTCADSETVR